MKTAVALAAATLPMGSTRLAIHPVTPDTWFVDGGTGSVTVDEILTLVTIALGNAQVSACPHGVPSGTGVNVALTIEAVKNSLSGCGA